MRLILRDKNTGEIIDYNATYPRWNLSEPVVGIDDNLEYLIYHEPIPAPAHDSRLYKTVRHYDVTTDPHPVYPNLNQYLISYTLERRSDEEINGAILSKERQVIDSNAPEEKVKKLLLLAVGIALKHADITNMNAKELIIRDKAMNVALKVFQNEVEIRNKLQQVIDGIDPDLDANLETGDAIDPPEPDIP